jgi:hypothetical protein
MDTLGIKASPEEIATMIKEIDVDNNGEIDFEEFVAVMSRKVNATYTPVEVKSAFKVRLAISFLSQFVSLQMNKNKNLFLYLSFAFRYLRLAPILVMCMPPT